MDALLDELGACPAGSNDAIPVIRALQRRLLMLAPLRARVERGDSVDGVLTSMGKALFWKDKDVGPADAVGVVGRAHRAARRRGSRRSNGS